MGCRQCLGPMGARGTFCLVQPCRVIRPHLDRQLAARQVRHIGLQLELKLSRIFDDRRQLSWQEGAFGACMQCVCLCRAMGGCPNAPFAEDKRVFSPPTLRAFATHSQVRMATIPASLSARLASRAAALCSASLPHPSALGEPEDKKAFSKRSFGCMRPRTGVNRSERTNNKEANKHSGTGLE